MCGCCRLSSLARESKQGSSFRLAVPAATVVLLLVTFVCTVSRHIVSACAVLPLCKTDLLSLYLLSSKQVISGPFKDKLQAQVAVRQLQGQVVPWHWVDLAAAVCSLLAWTAVSCTVHSSPV